MPQAVDDDVEFQCVASEDDPYEDKFYFGLFDMLLFVFTNLYTILLT